MGKFLKEEKPKQTAFKINAPYFSEGAQAEGKYGDHFYPFCLPRVFAQENLFPGIRQSIQDYFTEYSIKWHDSVDGGPSNHLCDSMVCCANFLFPFSDKPKALGELLSGIYPNLEQMLPIENEQYIAHEWIGQNNYLKEKISRNGKRSRGALFTSADAAVMFERTDGKKQIVLIEWKYTEAYYSTNKKYSKSGTDRSLIYRHLYDNDNDLMDKDIIPDFDVLFYDPFDQFMRQQYLANEMEKARERGADMVSLLHIAPDHNHDFKRITSTELRSLGHSATDVWGKIVKKLGRFLSVSTEDLFRRFDVSDFPELKNWYNYITSRYSWVTD
jgi:hypothetical protein